MISICDDQKTEPSHAQGTCRAGAARQVGMGDLYASSMSSDSFADMATSKGGNLRLDDPDHFVRLEIKAACPRRAGGSDPGGGRGHAGPTKSAGEPGQSGPPQRAVYPARELQF
jgi:hypothetical protein